MLDEIIRSTGMSTRPSFYSGRGATIVDLNSNILEKYWVAIKEKFGEDAAEAFVGMIVSIRVLSATTFLKTLNSLVANDWKGYREGSHFEADCEGAAFGTLFSVMGGSMQRDDTYQIKSDFLLRRGLPLPRRHIMDIYENSYKRRNGR